ncbi:MAG: hypothetical protein LBJ86_04815 [Spirochaetaceae bacterium]|nr:hypothetical protein [Spirochaetaceae bacterium]
MGSCITTISETREEREPELAEVSALTAENTEPEKAAFDPESVTPEIYNAVKEDITVFIHELNTIIRSRNYEAWRAYLDNEYYNYISSPDYLHRISSTDIMQKNKISLTTVNEYFTHVVVPSRYRDRVDDIEITGANKVKVITIDKGVRLRLYDLEKTKDGWKIVMPNSANS